MTDDRAAGTAGARRRSGGFTLAEVLIALALLTIGIFAALRIFPRGLDAILLNRHRMLAARLAQHEMRRLEARGEGMPEAIVATNSVLAGQSYVLEFHADYDPDDMRADETQALWVPASAGRPRTIIGETAHIGQSPWRFGQVDRDFAVLPACNLAFTPIAHLHDDADATDPDSDLYAEPVNVYSGKYQRTEDLLVLARPPASAESERYYINYRNGTISFDHVADRRRVLRIEYSWYRDAGSGTTEPGVSPTPASGAATSWQWVETVTVEQGEDTVAAPKPLAAASQTGFQGVVWGSEIVNLAFRREAGLNTVDQPDEYWLGDVRGLRGVEALAAGRSDLALVFASANAGKAVKIDYRVRDWTIFSEEQAIPDSREVKLTHSRIKPPDYKNEPREVTPSKMDADVTAAAIALDMETGERFVGGDFAPEDPGAENEQQGRFALDFKTGVARFPPGSTGRTYRIHYRAEDDWTVQVMKPAREYQRATAPANPEPGFREYVWDGASSDGQERRRVVFAPADADKAVSIDYWAVVDGSRQRFRDEVHRIAWPSEGGAHNEGVVYLNHEPVGEADGYLTVKGAGARARVLWVARGGSLTVQGSALGERWLKTTVEAFAPAGDSQ